MSKGLAVLLVALWFSAVASAAPPKRTNLPQLARSLAKSGAPGAIVYVRTPTAARAGTAGFADVAAHTTMRAGYRWRIASLTKAFVATLVLQLEAEHKLDIDDPVEHWLPGLVPTWTPRELVAFAFAHPALFPPGANWSYSNTNYILLGLVVETATGDNLGAELQRRIFAPLTLTATSFPQTLTLEPDFVHGYFSPARIDIAPLLSPTWGWAAGGIVSNARDVTTFYRGLLTGRLLPAAQLDEMKVPATVAGTYGLGIDSTFTACGRAFGHNGDFFGWRTEVLATANGKREAVVMINIDTTFVPWARLVADVKLALCRG